MIKKSILLLLLGLFSFSIIPVIAETPPEINLEYYSLHNMIDNGDFSVDSNSDGLADGWSYGGVSNFYIDENGQNMTAVSQYGRIFNSTSVISDCVYYIGLDYKVYSNNCRFYVDFLSTQSPVSYYNTYLVGDNLSHHFSVILNSTESSNIYGPTVRDYNASGWANFSFDEIIMVNLTKTFGAGNEPSLNDFETYYLPDGYFEDYNSYRPSIVEVVEGTEISIDEQLDWTTALISKNGGNIDLNIYMYLDDPDHYFDYPFALNARYYGITYDIDWLQDENNHNLFILDLSDPEENAIVKEILFDRSFKDNYLSFLIYAVPYVMSPSYWIDIESNFIYNVNIGGAVVSTRQGNLNDTCPLNSGYLSFYDAENNRINPSLILDQISIDTNQLTKVYDSFSTKYNSVSSFRFSIDDISYEGNVNTFYGQEIYELGVFAVNSVILIDGIDIDYGDDEISIDDIDQMFPIKVYEWYDIGGQLKNLFNYVGKELYMALPIQSLIDSVTGFVDYLTDFSTMLPPEWWAVIGSVVGLCFLGLALHLAEKWL
ncbi:MAG: hypothetical protein WC888_05555 [Candidatus Izemoplasmatales bacterium]|jgi:hypothetical protein